MHVDDTLIEPTLAIHDVGRQVVTTTASPAIAEQLERLNETLGGLASGGTDLRLKVRNG